MAEARTKPYPEGLQRRMRQTIADLVEWAAVMGGFESAVWGQAKNLMEEVRDFEDGRQTTCSVCGGLLALGPAWTTEENGPVCAWCLSKTAAQATFASVADEFIEGITGVLSNAKIPPDLKVVALAVALTSLKRERNRESGWISVEDLAEAAGMPVAATERMMDLLQSTGMIVKVETEGES